MPLASKRSYTHFTGEELRLLQVWHEEGRSAAEIVRRLRRDLSSVARRIQRLASGATAAPVGRPLALSPTQVNRLISVATELIEDAECRYQVTASMLKKALKLKCSEKTILQALHARGIRFHVFREKPLLTEEDVVDRLAFAAAHGGKSVTFWKEKVHAYLDDKYFTPYLTPAARVYARKITARGAFRGKKQGLDKGYVKPKKTMKQAFGRKVCMAVAISAKKVLTCFVVKKSWCGGCSGGALHGPPTPGLGRSVSRQAQVQPARGQ